MSSTLQTILALVLVALAAGLLVWHFFLRRRPPGCGGSCGAVSPEIKKLREKLKH